MPLPASLSPSLSSLSSPSSRPLPLSSSLSCSNCWLLPLFFLPIYFASGRSLTTTTPLHSFRIPKRQNLVVPSPILYTCDSLRPRSFRERPPHPLKPSKQRHRHRDRQRWVDRAAVPVLPYINTAAHVHRPFNPFRIPPSAEFHFFVLPSSPRTLVSGYCFLPGATHALISRGTIHHTRPNPHHLAPSPTTHLSDRPSRKSSSSGETSHSPARQ
jgi:hypothetical protein